MKVRDYMTTDAKYANLRDGLRQTYFRMREFSVRHMPVLDDHERLIGIVSDRDLRRPSELDEDPNTAYSFRLDNLIKVEAVMTREPLVVRPSDDLSLAVDYFLTHRFGALPVVSDTNAKKMVGIISTIDILRAYKHTL